jgi:3-hydroxyisobutyrate dehydrogenase
MPEDTSPPIVVAVLGLGAMGYTMATTLINKGFTVYGFDVSQAAMERFANAGGHSATTPMKAVVNADVVIVMVTNAEQVTSVMFDGLAAVDGLKLNAAVIISSTVTPDYYEYVTSFLAKECGRDDIHVVDSPVSGGVAGARSGTLSIYSSGSDAALNIAKPVLHALGTKVYTVPGGLGSGSKAKMCHQVLPEIDIALCAEAMAFAARAGLDTKEVFHAVQAGGGRSWIVGDRVLHMIDNDLFPYSVIPNSYKDSVRVVLGRSLISDPRYRQYTNAT